MTFYEFHLPDGNPVSVNPGLVACFQPAEEGTYIVFLGGDNLEVGDSYDAVAEMFNPERQAGC